MPPASELCFSVDRELTAVYPDFAERATEAAAAWGWSLRLADDCPSQFGIAELATNPDGSVPMGVHRPALVDGERRPAMWSDGASQILLNAEAVGTGKIQDETAEECFAQGGDGHVVLLARVLIHELGHALGLGESDAYEAMLRKSGYCVAIMPSEAELAAVSLSD